VDIKGILFSIVSSAG